MKPQMNSTRVSLAYGNNLSQVPQFNKDNSHLQIGLANEHLHPKKLSTSNLNMRESNGVPPGFEGSSSLNKKRVPNIASIQWMCPPQLSMSPKWLVAAGEESQEPSSQRIRESKVLEAIYLHRSSIPANPIVSLEMQRERYDDSLTPIVPLIPIEEIQKTPIIPSAKFPLASETRKTPYSAPSDKSNVVAAAALTVLLKSGEFASIIDTDLLLKILSDPKMIGALLNNNSKTNSPVPLSCLGVLPPGTVGDSVNKPCVGPTQMKEEGYYKDLIRQHGGERRENIINETTTHFNCMENLNMEQKPNVEQNKDNPEISRKRCKFFNGKNGCRRGISCLFLHEAKPIPWRRSDLISVEEQSAKRLRVS